MSEQQRKYRRKPLTQYEAFSEHGKLPPQATDLEEVVLGSLMLQPKSFDSVANILKPEAFYKEQHQAIARAIFELRKQNIPVDILTVTNKLKSNGELELAGGAFYVTQLTMRIASTENIEEHAAIILQKYLQRESIRISTEIIGDAYEDTTDVFDLLSKAENDFTNLNQRSATSTGRDISDVAVDMVKEVELTAQLKEQDKISGIETGFTDLNNLTNGFQNGELIIPAGRPGMGKTAYLLHILKQNAKQGKRGLIFSLEMESEKLVRRLVVGLSGLYADQVKRGNLSPEDWKRFHSAVRLIEQLPIIIHDEPCNINDIKNIARKNAKDKKIDFIIIDYIQLIMPEYDRSSSINRDQELGLISRSLKALAKELNCPIIAPSQLNRSVETRTTKNKEPQLSDLRESGNIEQDADMVLFLYRPEYYGYMEDEHGNSTKGIGKIIIGKYREGSNEQIKFRYNESLTELSDFVEFEVKNEFQKLSVNNHYEVERDLPF